MYFQSFYGLISTPDVLFVLINMSTSQNYVIQGSCNFINGNSLFFTTLSRLWAKGVVIVKFLVCQVIQQGRVIKDYMAIRMEAHKISCQITTFCDHRHCVVEIWFQFFTWSNRAFQIALTSRGKQEILLGRFSHCVVVV